MPSTPFTATHALYDTVCRRLLIRKAATVQRAACSMFREKKRLEAEALARFEREEEEARVAAEAAAAAER